MRKEFLPKKLKELFRNKIGGVLRDIKYGGPAAMRQLKQQRSFKIVHFVNLLQQKMHNNNQTAFRKLLVFAQEKLWRDRTVNQNSGSGSHGYISQNSTKSGDLISQKMKKRAFKILAKHQQAQKANFFHNWRLKTHLLRELNESKLQRNQSSQLQGLAAFDEAINSLARQQQ